MFHRAADHHHLEARLLQLLQDRHGHAEAGDEGAGALGDDHVDAGGERLGGGGEEIDAERAVGELAHLTHLVADLVRPQARHAQDAVAPRIGHRRRQLGVSDAAHAGEQDGMVDLKQIAQGGTQGHGRFLDILIIQES